jgi:hypothetical protein
MMDAEGMMDEEIWEARVMSDPIIVIADLISPGKKKSGQSSRSRRMRRGRTLMDAKDCFRWKWRK